MRHAIGIDLGTTYSAIAYVNSAGKPEVIPNEFQHMITPSLISFAGPDPVVGDEAREHQRAGKTEIAAFFKRNLDDAHFLRTFHDKEYSAIDLSALVLTYLKVQAERFLQAPVSEAVIAVPAYFTSLQRAATLQAARQAGLHVLKIVDEPTAAALSYRWPATTEEQRVLVYDLGGGTFDISLLSISGQRLQVLAVEGDHHLGGKDWDDRLMRHLATEFERDFGQELSDSSVETLRASVERAKRALSLRQSGTVLVQSGSRQKSYTLTRSQFEQLTADLMERTQLLTEATLQNAGTAWNHLSGVLLVGGSTRMPMVQAYLKRASGREPLAGIHPDEAVALGAALHARQTIQECQMDPGRQQTVVDAIAHSLGTIALSAERTHYVNSILIQKNAALPAASTRLFEVPLRPDGQTQLEIFLTQGESADPQHCLYLGLYLFRDFPRLQSTTAVVEITYAYDSNGLVQVSALEVSSRQPLALTTLATPANVPARFLRALPASQHTQLPVTVYLALDLSISASGPGLESLKKASLAFLKQCDLQALSVGLISFSDASMVHLSATHDERALRRTIEQLTVGVTGHGNNGQPFDELYAQLADLAGLRRALILTDGVWAYSEEAIARARRCQQAGITLHALGFGQADPAFLARIASTPQAGQFYTPEQLTEALKKLAQRLSKEAGGKEKTIEWSI